MGDTDAPTGKLNIDISATLLSILAAAKSVVAFTGAGISAESGVPTFRGAEGIWNKLKPEELANINAFMKNPELVWEWYAHRKKIVAGIQPNSGHYALAKMEQLFPHFAIVTQNVDNLHRRAGSKTVYELHGNIERNYCMKCGTAYSDATIFGGGEMTIPSGGPHCTRCNGLVRPDVVWFGEMLPDDEWEMSVRAAESSDVLLSIGTSGAVYPAASIPLMAKQQGAYVVEINPEPTPLTDRADEFLQGMSGVILPALYQRIITERRPPTS